MFRSAINETSFCLPHSGVSATILNWCKCLIVPSFPAPHPPQALACTLSKNRKASLCHCKHYLRPTAPPPPIFEFEENARGRGPAPVLSARAPDQRRYIAPSPFRAGGGYTPKDPKQIWASGTKKETRPKTAINGGKR